MTKKKLSHVAVLLATGLAFSAIHAQSTDSTAGLAPSALKQIRAIYALKASLTPAEQKMSSNLVLLSRLAQGKLPAELASLVQMPARDADGRIAVDVNGRPGVALANSLASIADVDSNVVLGERHHIRAHVSLAHLAKLAAQSDV